jgi:alanine dehydrogenase
VLRRRPASRAAVPLSPAGNRPPVAQEWTTATKAAAKDQKDEAIDQGGAFEASRPTAYESLIFEVEGIRHYCVANMPGGVPRTSPAALTNATLP